MLLAELNDLMISYKEGDNVSVIQNTPHQNVILSFSMSSKPTPEMISPIIGDIVHNLRSSLDVMASEMVRAAGLDDMHVHFPICSDISKLKKMTKDQHFDDAGPDAVELLKEIKPYKDGNDDLWALHQLSLRDKHRSLAEIRTRIFGPIIRMWDDDGTHNPTIVSDPDVDFIFPSDGPFAGIKILAGLEQCMTAVENVLQSYERLMTQRENK